MLASQLCFRHLLMSLALGVGLPGLALASEQVSFPQRFEAEAAAGWDTLKRSMSPLVGRATWTYEVDVTDPGDPEYGKHVFRNQKLSFWIIEGAAKVRVETYDQSGRWSGGSVYGVNPEYAFVLGQAVQDGPYFIKSCGRDIETIERVRLQLDVTALAYLRTPYGIESDFRTLPDLTRSGGFKLLSCKGLQEPSRELAEVEFTFTPVGQAATGDPSVRRARVVLDPTQNWRVIRSGTTRDGEHSELSVDYASTDATSMSALVRRSTFPKSKITERIVYEPFSHAITPRGEFYLPTYGLPECPVTGSGRRVSSLFWIGANLVVIGLIAVALYYLRERRRNASRSPS
jgi:hypothetical protein